MDPNALRVIKAFGESKGDNKKLAELFAKDDELKRAWEEVKQDEAAKTDVLRAFLRVHGEDREVGRRFRASITDKSEPFTGVENIVEGKGFI